MESISELMQDLIDLTAEIKVRNKEVKTLREKKKETEAKIMLYLREHEQPGVQLNNIVVIKNEKEKRERKKKKEKLEDGSSVLKKYGINNPEQVLEELIESMKGNKIPTTVLTAKVVSS